MPNAPPCITAHHHASDVLHGHAAQGDAAPGDVEAERRLVRRLDEPQPLPPAARERERRLVLAVQQEVRAVQGVLRGDAVRHRKPPRLRGCACVRCAVRTRASVQSLRACESARACDCAKSNLVPGGKPRPHLAYSSLYTWHRSAPHSIPTPIMRARCAVPNVPPTRGVRRSLHSWLLRQVSRDRTARLVHRQPVARRPCEVVDAEVAEVTREALVLALK